MSYKRKRKTDKRKTLKELANKEMAAIEYILSGKPGYGASNDVFFIGSLDALRKRGILNEEVQQDAPIHPCPFRQDNPLDKPLPDQVPPDTSSAPATSAPPSKSSAESQSKADKLPFDDQSGGCVVGGLM